MRNKAKKCSNESLSLNYALASHLLGLINKCNETQYGVSRRFIKLFCVYCCNLRFILQFYKPTKVQSWAKNEVNSQQDYI